MPWLYRWELDADSRHLWTESSDLPNGLTFRDDFIGKIAHQYHMFMMVHLQGNEPPVGFVFSYNFNRTDGFLHTSVYIEPKNRDCLVGGEAGAVFYDYLFTHFPLRKIYANVFGYNVTSHDLLLSAGFVLEGDMKRHHYYAGEYHSMLTLALYRDEFYERAAPILRSWRVRGGT